MISSESFRHQYTGNSSATSFAYGFPVGHKSHLKVTLTEIATETDTTLTVDTHYTVNGVDDSNSANWYITYPVSGSPMASTHRLTITPDLPLKQETDFRNQGSFQAQTHEDAMDYLTVVSQQLQEQIDRSVKLAVGSTENSDDVLADIKQSVVDCASSASSASSSASSASTSASSAASSASSASTSATNASTSATNASTSATNAASSATSASTSATNASTSATNASTSATNAASSASSASTSAVNSAASETAAALSASSASTSASAASTSATASASSASAASTSATSAASSASAAAASASSVNLPASPVAGDMLYHNGTSWQRLAKGTADQLLRMNAGATAPEWATKLQLPQTPTSGDMLYYNGTSWVSLAKGTSSQELRMNAGATAPEWFTAASASLPVVVVTHTVSDGGSPATQETGSTSWQTLIFNTKEVDTDSLATLSSNHITLPAGTWFMVAAAYGHNSGNDYYANRLRDTSNNVTKLVTGMNYTNGGQAIVNMNGVFTLSGSTNLELQNIASTGGQAFTYKTGNTISETHILKRMVFIKIA